MKPMKLEFVVFNISQENAVFLWKSINKVIEFLGFDTTGNVTELTENMPKGGHAIIPGVKDVWGIHYPFLSEDTNETSLRDDEFQTWEDDTYHYKDED